MSFKIKDQIDFKGGVVLSRNRPTETTGLYLRGGRLNVATGGITIDAGGLTITAGGQTITDGGLTVTAGGLTISAGGLDVTGNIGFFGTTPVAQASAYTQTFSTADKTHANATTATLTDSTTGTAADTLAATVNPTAVDVTLTGTCADSAGTNTALGVLADRDATFAREQAALVADLADLKQLVNAVIDDLQAYGLFQ